MQSVTRAATHHYHVQHYNKHGAISEPHAVVQYSRDGGSHKGPQGKRRGPQTGDQPVCLQVVRKAV